VFPIAECRKILGDGCPLSDLELEQLRDQLYELARSVVDLSQMPLNEPDRLIAQLRDDVRPDVEERAAILEFDGGVTRRLAERRAFTASFRSRKANR
jgi:hypothetical protein